MMFYYRNTLCTFTQFLSAYLATAISEDENHKLRTAKELIERRLQCMAPTQKLAEQVLYDTCGQVHVDLDR